MPEIKPPLIDPMEISGKKAPRFLYVYGYLILAFVVFLGVLALEWR